MTRDEYGQAYQSGFPLTTRFLISQGIPGDAATEAAQAGWVRGWERIRQLRSSRLVVTWVNSIALNLHRSYLRKPAFEALRDVPMPAQVYVASIDLKKILSVCNSEERECSYKSSTWMESAFPRSLTSRVARRQRPEFESSGPGGPSMRGSPG